jgi:hypothetical protein
MKKCTYCGTEFPDDTSTCTIDGNPLTLVGSPAPSAHFDNQPGLLRHLKAGIACGAIHTGLTTLLALVLVAAGVNDSFDSIIIPYMYFGWIPLALLLYPFLFKKSVAFRWHRKSDLIAGMIVFGFMALLFLMSAAFGDKIADQIRWNRTVISKSDPSSGQKITTWRYGMLSGSLFSAVLSWLCYRGSRRTAD